MKRFTVSVLLIIMCFLLQTTVFQWINLGGIVPNLMIILTASFGFMRGERTGLLFGFFCGLLVDIFFAFFKVSVFVFPLLRVNFLTDSDGFPAASA